MNTREEGTAPYEDARMQRLSALYDRYCRQVESEGPDSSERRQDAAVPCKLAPAVLRRAVGQQPQ